MKVRLQTEYEKEFDQAATLIKDQLRVQEGLETRSRLEHVLQQWLLESRQLYGQFPIYPSEETQGSLVLFKEMTIDEVQKFVNQVKKAL